MTRLLALAAVLVMAGCGSQTEGKLPGAVTNPAPTVGCTATDTEELYVAALWDCHETSVYLFQSTSARDNWRKIAEGLGAVVIREGDTWLEVKA